LRLQFHQQTKQALLLAKEDGWIIKEDEQIAKDARQIGLIGAAFNAIVALLPAKALR
jgi:hypothetical protein